MMGQHHQLIRERVISSIALSTSMAEALNLIRALAAVPGNGSIARGVQRTDMAIGVIDRATQVLKTSKGHHQSVVGSAIESVQTRKAHHQSVVESAIEAVHTNPLFTHGQQRRFLQLALNGYHGEHAAALRHKLWRSLFGMCDMRDASA